MNIKLHIRGKSAGGFRFRVSATEGSAMFSAIADLVKPSRTNNPMVVCQAEHSCWAKRELENEFRRGFSRNAKVKYYE